MKTYQSHQQEKGSLCFVKYLAQNWEFFIDLRPQIKGSVGPKIQIITLEDIRHMPRIYQNVISMSRMHKVWLHAKII